MHHQTHLTKLQIRCFSQLDDMLAVSTHKICFHKETRKIPTSIMDRFFHWRIKVTYHFEDKVNQKVNLGRCQTPPPNTCLPWHHYFTNCNVHHYFNGRNFFVKNLSNKKNIYLNIPFIQRYNQSWYFNHLIPLPWVDSSTTTLWTSLLPKAGVSGRYL